MITSAILPSQTEHVWKVITKQVGRLSLFHVGLQAMLTLQYRINAVAWPATPTRQTELATTSGDERTREMEGSTP